MSSNPDFLSIVDKSYIRRVVLEIHYIFCIFLKQISLFFANC
ncbi:hypothetical protein HMPREF3208_00628 [Gardnerella vaginalis]|uniref:Uncharacterized protein n=1 Tax=Gardnerella vaginalis TaxID=2702 RepID=A0A133NYH1_GARVA|nr:hypothetical protein HMPREF3208_00628 [Gardnerella vaginalis]